MKNDYPQITPRDMADVINLLTAITKERPDDINDFENLQNRFMSGRKVAKIPTGASDVADTDRIGDFNIAEDSGVFYFITLVDNGGTAEWRRSALSSW